MRTWESEAAQLHIMNNPMNESNGINYLRNWLLHLHRQGRAEIDDDGVVLLDSLSSSKFGIGQTGSAVFLAFPPDTANWAHHVPWDYAAIRRGRRDLNLVASIRPIDLGMTGNHAPSFAMSFTLPSIADITTVYTYGQLQLRRLSLGHMHLTESVVERESFSTIQVHMLENDQSVFDATASVKARVRSGAGRAG